MSRLFSRATLPNDEGILGRVAAPTKLVRDVRVGSLASRLYLTSSLGIHYEDSVGSLDLRKPFTHVPCFLGQHSQIQ